MRLSQDDIDSVHAFRDDICVAMGGLKKGVALTALGMVVTAILRTCDEHDQERWLEKLRQSLEESTNSHTRQ